MFSYKAELAKKEMVLMAQQEDICNLTDKCSKLQNQMEADTRSKCAAECKCWFSLYSY